MTSRLGIIIAIITVLACDSGNPTADPPATNRSASITLRLDIEPPPPQHPSKTLSDRAIGEPDVCIDYQIDTIAVDLYRTQDNAKIASVQKACSEHSLTINEVPAGELLHLVCRGITDTGTSWQGQVNDITVDAGQTKDVGPLTMTYIGADAAAPEIAATFPPENAVDVDLNAWVMVIFNEPLASGTIPDQAVAVSNNDIPVPGRVAYDPGMRAIRFTPDAALDPSITYTATLRPQGEGHQSMTDIAGHAYTTEVTWQFTTRGAEDKTAPQIIAASPANGAMDVDQQSTLSVLFSEPMDPTAFTAGVFQLSSDQGPATGEIAYNEQTRTLTLTPDFSLNATTLYTTEISTLAKDLSQNSPVAPYSWQFWTSGPLNDLITAKTGNGTGRVTGTSADIDCGNTCHTDVMTGTTITLEATADQSSEFTGWSGDFCTGETGPCSFTLTGNTTITANFKLLTYTITATVSPEDGSGGAITPQNSTVNHADDLIIDIKPKPFYSISELILDGSPVTPASNYMFNTITKNHTIHATFKNNKSSALHPPGVTSYYYQDVNSKGHVVWSVNNETTRDIWYDNGSEASNLTQTYDLNGTHIAPKISSNGQVVWITSNDSDKNDIFYYDGSQVTNLSETYAIPGAHSAHRIYENGHVVWICNTNSTDYTAYHYNGSAVENIFEISGNISDLQAIARGQAVWSALNGADTDIFYYDGSTTTVISEDTADPHKFAGINRYPQINENGHVVWENSNSGLKICYYDGSDSIIISGNSNPDNIYRPHMNDNGHVVWDGRSSGSMAIYYFDGSTTTNITPTLTGVHREPQVNVDGHVVWWTYYPGENQKWDIYYFDGSTRTNVSNNTNDYTIYYDGPGIRIAENGQVVWYGHSKDNGYELFHSFY